VAGKVEALWFFAGLTTGAIGTLLVGLPYLTDVVQQADNSKKSAAHKPAATPPPLSDSLQRMISSLNVSVAKDEMLLIHGTDGVAVLRFEVSEPAAAEYHWRCLGRSAQTVETGSGSVVRKPGEDFLKTLALGKVSIDWLGRSTEGTVLYYRTPTRVEKRPSSEFDAIDLAAMAE
jgi:hypothetical protein